jgi:hypothetical protein
LRAWENGELQESLFAKSDQPPQDLLDYYTPDMPEHWELRLYRGLRNPDAHIPIEHLAAERPSGSGGAAAVA